MITVTAKEAQQRFGQLLDAVEREPVEITRHGHAAAFLVSPQDMRELQAFRHKRSNAVADFASRSSRAAITGLPASAGLTDEDIVQMVEELREPLSGG